MVIKQQQQQVFVEENMSNLTCATSGEASASSSNTRGEPSSSIYLQNQYFSQQNQSQDQYHEQLQEPPTKKKRNLPGNPDPDAEVIALSPKSLLATNRFLCEICNKGFQRDQNLQLHRRGHNLPWKLKQRENKEVKKKVYVCPETSCVHHDPSRALGDLTGIKKHFCRKHGEKKWKCDKCSKRYAVQSDWKAHSKVCGTREYRCDCGTLFSRRDSFITHRAFCDALAEESARAITTNPLLSNPVTAAAPPSTSHFINSLQQQQQAQFNSQHDPLHSFSLKREHQNLISLPPWLDHHHHANNNHLTSAPSSSIFHQDQLMQLQQQPQDPHDYNPQSDQQNPRMGPTTSFPSLEAGPYHTQAPPHMSATALLQKAAQIGATMSRSTSVSTAQPHHQGHVSDTNSNTPTTTTTAGMFGLNLSSRDPHQEIMSSTSTIVSHGLSSFGNKAATTPIAGSDHITGPGPGPSPSSTSFLHAMMMNTLSSSYDHQDDHAFGIAGMLGSSTSSNMRNGGDGGGSGGGGGGGGGNEGLTRDFLGLRPLSQSDILTIAGLGNCMQATDTTTSHDHEQDNDKPWQG